MHVYEDTTGMANRTDKGAHPGNRMGPANRQCGEPSNRDLAERIFAGVSGTLRFMRLSEDEGCPVTDGPSGLKRPLLPTHGQGSKRPVGSNEQPKASVTTLQVHTPQHRSHLRFIVVLSFIVLAMTWSLSVFAQAQPNIEESQGPLVGEEASVDDEGSNEEPSEEIANEPITSDEIGRPEDSPESSPPTQPSSQSELSKEELEELHAIEQESIAHDEDSARRVDFGGYAALEGEVIQGLDLGDKQFGLGLAEVALILTVLPTDRISVRSFVIYKLGMNLNDMFMEANGTYSVTDAFNVQIGRLLVPLGVVNMNFFAPVNTAVSLPISVSHHMFYPISIDGMRVHGSAFFGREGEFKYSLFGGHYRESEHHSFGPLGFRGSMFEMSPTMTNQGDATDAGAHASHGGAALTLDHSATADHEHADLYGVGARVAGSPTRALTLGIDFFLNTREDEYLGETLNGLDVSVGGDVSGSVNDFSLTLSANARRSISNAPVSPILSGYLEAQYRIAEVVMPFVRGEYLRQKGEVDDPHDDEYMRAAGGLNLQPNPWMIFKLEYARYIMLSEMRSELSGFNAFLTQTSFQY